MIVKIRTWLILIFVIASSIAFTRRVYGSLVYTPNTYGLTARGMGMGNAMTGDHEDFSTTYANPAGLGVSSSVGINTNYLLAVPKLEGGLKGGQKVRQEDNNNIVLLNFRTDLSRLFSDKVNLPTIGFGGSVGVDDNFRTLMVFDDMRSYKGEFYRYGMANSIFQGALGVEVTDWFSLGVGFHGGFRGYGLVTTRTSVEGESVNQGTKMLATFRPVLLGGAYFHGETWGLGITYREFTRGTFDPIRVSATPTISGYALPTLEMNFNFFDTYVPRQIWVGTHVDVNDTTTINADIGWVQWSEYEIEVSDANWVGSLAKFDTIDIYTPRVGFETEPSDSWKIRGGYRFEQTPFRKIGTRFPQTGDLIKGKVVLDNDVHILSAGAGYVFDSREFFTLDVALDAAYQMHYFVPREALSSDGYEYESEGMLHAFTVGLTLSW